MPHQLQLRQQVAERNLLAVAAAAVHDEVVAEVAGLGPLLQVGALERPLQRALVVRVEKVLNGRRCDANVFGARRGSGWVDGDETPADFLDRVFRLSHRNVGAAQVLLLLLVLADDVLAVLLREPLALNVVEVHHGHDGVERRLILLRRRSVALRRQQQRHQARQLLAQVRLLGVVQRICDAHVGPATVGGEIDGKRLDGLARPLSIVLVKALARHNRRHARRHAAPA
mmetsp:Transcript_9271/g.32675  ORF Transcript_9271/g.32675 Transcript_9271/m.32675 type:complete len:228 (+) Transcript_9271:1447-2130(+)